MSDNIYDIMIEAIGEDMRRKRRQKQIDELFNAPFIEDVAEPVTGYKSLVFDETADHFSSNYNGQRWDYDGVEAVCAVTDERKHDPKQVPHPNCSCGIYAYDRFTPNLVNPNPMSSLITVELKAGGYVHPHSLGFKASIAKISAIYVPFFQLKDMDRGTKSAYLGRLDRLAKRYEVEFKHFPIEFRSTNEMEHERRVRERLWQQRVYYRSPGPSPLTLKDINNS